jgi:hypothetical protein
MSLDEFREAGAFIDDESEPTGSSRKGSRSSSRSRGAGGITPVQRFILALMFLMMTCLLGMFFLVATGRIVPPGLY